MYQLEFGAGQVEHFSICWQALIAADSNSPPRLEEYDDYIGLIRKFKSVSVEDNKNAPLRDLNVPVTIELENSEYKLLLRNLNRPMWPPLALELVDIVKTRLKTLEAKSAKSASTLGR